MSEAISSALGRAQNLTFTIFSAALVISVLVLNILTENRNALERLNTEFDRMSTIVSHSDTVIREIRGYMLAKLPSNMSEEQALREIRHAFSNAFDKSGKISQWLIDSGRRELFFVTAEINGELEDLRNVNGKPVSVNVDLSPQSIIILDRLEELRLRDLIVLAHLVSVDPIALDKTVSAFAAELSSFTQTTDIEARASQLAADLAEHNGLRDENTFQNAGRYATTLRQVCEKFGTTYSPLAPGGLESNFASVKEKLRELDDMRGPVSDRLSGNFQISVPIIDQTLPASFVTLLFPLGLVGGYGLINTALLFARRKILAIPDLEKRRAAADVGYLFDQLNAGSRLISLINWLLMIILITAPWIAAAAMAHYFGIGQTLGFRTAVICLMVPGFLIVLSIIDTSHSISQAAKS